MSVLGISTKGNEEQAELLRLILDKSKPIVICNGKAGTGKNFVSIAAAIQLKLDKKYNRIIYSRNAVEVGKSLGYLKGDLEEKFGPYTLPLSDTIESIIYNSDIKLNYNDLMQKVECMPVAYTRGRNLENTILIIDECQNLSFTELQTLITRMGKYSKIILIGSFSQIDDPQQLKKQKCDFQTTAEALSELSYVGYVELKKSMRSEYCAEIDDIFEKLKKQK